MSSLLSESQHPFQAVPFDKIKAADFMPALNIAVQRAKDQLNELKINKEKVTFENSVELLESSSEQIGLISNIFFALHGAESDDALRDVAKEFSPLLTEFSNDILLDQQIFDKIKQCYENRQNYKLNSEQRKLIEESYLDFIRNGALLNNADKEKLREIDKKLSKLALDFGDNVLKETHKHFLEVNSKDDLMGLPDWAIEMSAEEAKLKGKEGKYIFTLDFPSYSPFMKYADRRDLREKLFKLYSSRAFIGQENNNQEIVLEITKLKWERAQLLGYKTHADFVLEKRMANSPQRVDSFLKELLVAAKPFAMNEMVELQNFQKELQGKGRLERWDYSYYAEKLKKKKYDIDDEILRPYFKLENVIDGIFNVANKLYNLTFEQLSHIPVYHPDVKVYEVRDAVQNKHIGLFYADFFPRKGKRNGAWMTVLREQKKTRTQNIRPHVSIVCNFTKPTSTTPSLLNFDEVSTLFHEFGHALHGLLTDCQYSRLSGTNVYWDFVELPSQILENWVFEKECLDLFANHYETNEKIPAEFIQRIRESSKFHEGIATLRQLSFALLDMSWHGKDLREVKSIDTWESEAISEANLFPPIEGTNMSCSFSHIFNGGYSAGYYSYKWAEVLDADAFQLFKEKGIFNREVALKFREFILSKGGTEHPLELYIKFRGKEPSLKALLERGGLCIPDKKSS